MGNSARTTKGKQMKNKAAQQLGRKGGQATSAAKAAAARRNGKLGGRPRKLKTKGRI
jgi:hypothetical protein